MGPTFLQTLYRNVAAQMGPTFLQTLYRYVAPHMGPTFLQALCRYVATPGLISTEFQTKKNHEQIHTI